MKKFEEQLIAETNKLKELEASYNQVKSNIVARVTLIFEMTGWNNDKANEIIGEKFYIDHPSEKEDD